MHVNVSIHVPLSEQMRAGVLLERIPKHTVTASYVRQHAVSCECICVPVVRAPPGSVYLASKCTACSCALACLPYTHTHTHPS